MTKGCHTKGTDPPRFRLETTLKVRVSHGEKGLITLLAKLSGVSVGRFLTDLARDAGRRALPSFESKARSNAKQILARAVRRKRKAPPRERLLRDLELPFLHRKSAQPLERALRRAASEARVSTYSVAWVFSHVVEAIAGEVARGHVVRIPGFAAIGPWRLEDRGVCVPRLQASQAFKDYLLIEGSRVGANRAMQAHRRRRRRKLQNLPKAMEAFRSRVEAQNRGLLEDFEAWHAYGDGAGLY